VRRFLCLLAGAFVFATTTAVSAQPSPGLDALLSAGGAKTNAPEDVGLVRQTVLSESALVLGARAGLADRAREIIAILESRQVELDRRFSFGRLVLAQGVLPPVISESRDVVALDIVSMRVAGIIYKIDEPARFAMPTPTWRDWLLIGLDAAAPAAAAPIGELGPKTAAERVFWESRLRASYSDGREQAQQVFDSNFARLERTYEGMRKFFELVDRGMVTSPVIVSASDVVSREDPSTIAVGSTVFRITAGADFTPAAAWKPLE